MDKPKRNKLKVKVCGMKNYNNIALLLNASPDFMGMIFYPKSARNVPVDFSLPEGIHQKVKVVGVFVNEEQANILEIARKHHLKYLQLHGDESVDYCKGLQSAGFKIIKVFSMGEVFDFSVLEPYENACDYFLFDTKGKLPGGNGIVFNWNLLKDRTISKPYFLSGGINPLSAEGIKEFSKNAPNLFGVDINSGFEISPGLKDINKISTFINEIRL